MSARLPLKLPASSLTGPGVIRICSLVASASSAHADALGCNLRYSARLILVAMSSSPACQAESANTSKRRTTGERHNPSGRMSDTVLSLTCLEHNCDSPDENARLVAKSKSAFCDLTPKPTCSRVNRAIDAKFLDG